MWKVEDKDVPEGCWRYELFIFRIVSFCDHKASKSSIGDSLIVM